MSLIEDRWSRVFEAYQLQAKIDAEGHADISAEEIRQLHIQPRLITKMDFSHQVPRFMADQGINVVTLTRSKWRVGFYDTHFPIPAWSPPDEITQSFAIPDWLETLRSGAITGEGAVVSSAHVSGMLEDFVGEDVTPTLSGRFSSGVFDYKIRTKVGFENISVSNAQIELDGGFEGREAVYLIEAKKHMLNDFNLRQLYYPFRTWSAKVSKPVKCILLNYVNDAFDFYEIEFSVLTDYDSASIVRTKKYLLGAPLPTSADLEALAMGALITGDPSLFEGTLPQANTNEFLFDLLDFLSEEPQTVATIAERFNFVGRQADYYFNALRYFGLAIKDGPYRLLSDEGKRIAALPIRDQYLAVAKLMLQVGPVARGFLEFRATAVMPTTEQFMEWMIQHGFNRGIDGSTVRRRAGTLVSWVSWLANLN